MKAKHLYIISTIISLMLFPIIIFVNLPVVFDCLMGGIIIMLYFLVYHFHDKGFKSAVELIECIASKQDDISVRITNEMINHHPDMKSFYGNLNKYMDTTEHDYLSTLDTVATTGKQGLFVTQSLMTTNDLVIKSNEIEKSLYLREKKNLLIILDTNKKELVGASDALDYFDLDNIIILDHHELGETSIDANY